MGTDVRCHLEYRERDRWVGFGQGFALRRDYELFRLLANVRGTGALYPPRGVPRDTDEPVRDAYCLRVYPGDAAAAAQRGRGLIATRAEAEEYVARGVSAWWDARQGFVTDPESTGASWLTTAEWRAVLAYYDAHIAEYLAAQGRDVGRAAVWLDIQCRMVLAAMTAAEERGQPARCVFWFVR